jgi:hypothetical protein
MTNRGGARAGAGRPNKYDFWQMVTIGQACEKLWQEASNAASKARLDSLPHADSIKELLERASYIPVHQRKAWLESEAYKEDHRGDLEGFLHDRAGTPLDESSLEYEGDPPRVIAISNKPPRGTRRRIIEDVATETRLSKNAVDNLWQAYRRLEKSLEDADEI